MRKRKVWRFYCEFCGRGGCSGGHVAKHERGCTANPNRECGMHPMIGDPQPPMNDLLKPLMSEKESGDWDWERAMDGLRYVASGCPACILAAIRQSGIQKHTAWDEEGHEHVPDLKFDFKKEKREFWNQYNEDQRASYDRY